MTSPAPSRPDDSRPLDWGAWGECLVPVGTAQAELKAELRRQIGATPSWAGRMSACPWLGFACADFIGNATLHLDAQLRRLIGLIVSRDNSCRHCYGVQRATLKVFGHPDEYLARLERDYHSVALSPQTRAALTFARKISRADPRPGADDFAELARVGFSRTAIAEIAFAAATGVFMNRIATILALPPDPLEAITESWFFRFIRPLIVLQLNTVTRLQRTPHLAAPPPAPAGAPGTAVLGALADSPAAAVLRRGLDRAWSSDLLPRRTKALMAAVIAKALRCANGEAEARTLLGAEGLSRTDVDEILANLGSAELDARDARLVPFARDTVRYQAPAIQLRARQATVGLSPGEILEAVGVASLMNAVSRLSVLLEAC